MASAHPATWHVTWVTPGASIAPSCSSFDLGAYAMVEEPLAVAEEDRDD